MEKKSSPSNKFQKSELTFWKKRILGIKMKDYSILIAAIIAATVIGLILTAYLYDYSIDLILEI
jgi:hypothetical protein